MDENCVLVKNRNTVSGVVKLANGRLLNLKVTMKRKKGTTGGCIDASTVFNSVASDVTNTLDKCECEATLDDGDGTCGNWDVKYKTTHIIIDYKNDPTIMALLEADALKDMGGELWLTDKFTDKLLKHLKIRPYVFFFKQKYKGLFFTKTGIPLTKNNLKQWLSNHL